MTYRLKVVIFACFCSVFSFWWFGVNNQTAAPEELGYTPQEFIQDVTKIYSDLGNVSEKRGDFDAAIKAYQTILKHNPNDLDIQHRLTICQNKLR